MSIKLFSIKRKSIKETRYHPKMGVLNTRVTYIKKTIAGFPIKTLHKYRETYFGQVKDCNECRVGRMNLT